MKKYEYQFIEAGTHNALHPVITTDCILTYVEMLGFVRVLGLDDVCDRIVEVEIENYGGDIEYKRNEYSVQNLHEKYGTDFWGLCRRFNQK